MGNGNRLIETMGTQTKRGVRPSFSFSFFKHAAISLLPWHLPLTLFSVAVARAGRFPCCLQAPLLSFTIPPFWTGRDNSFHSRKVVQRTGYVILVSLIRDSPANHDNAPGRFPFLKSGLGGQKGDATAQKWTRQSSPVSPPLPPLSPLSSVWSLLLTARQRVRDSAGKAELPRLTNHQKYKRWRSQRCTFWATTPPTTLPITSTAIQNANPDTAWAPFPPGDLSSASSWHSLPLSVRRVCVFGKISFALPKWNYFHKQRNFTIQ